MDGPFESPAAGGSARGGNPNNSAPPSPDAGVHSKVKSYPPLRSVRSITGRPNCWDSRAAKTAIELFVKVPEPFPSIADGLVFAGSSGFGFSFDPFLVTTNS